MGRLTAQDLDLFLSQIVEQLRPLVMTLPWTLQLPLPDSLPMEYKSVYKIVGA